MKSQTEKKVSEEKAGRIKKNLAIATVAASLGLSLGVPVADVLAANESLSNPPAHSNLHKEMGSKQLKIRQEKIESSQGKIKSNQGKVGYKVEKKVEQTK